MQLLGHIGIDTEGFGIVGFIFYFMLSINGKQFGNVRNADIAKSMNRKTNTELQLFLFFLVEIIILSFYDCF